MVGVKTTTTIKIMYRFTTPRTMNTLTIPVSLHVCGTTWMTDIKTPRFVNNILTLQALPFESKPSEASLLNFNTHLQFIKNASVLFVWCPQIVSDSFPPIVLWFRTVIPKNSINIKRCFPYAKSDELNPRCDGSR